MALNLPSTNLSINSGSSQVFIHLQPFSPTKKRSHLIPRYWKILVFLTDWYFLFEMILMRLMINSLDIQPCILISKVHLNHIFKPSPLDLLLILEVLEILIFNEYYSRFLCFTVIKHLVCTQKPTTTILAFRIFSEQ
ncbi:hypothetical protein VP01_1625g10 [Puccinia sorghi]|uniref:Uncharacterized protein n=1 Tax=Puccinia sorghi TaxID=27349 RepID=A0A0L6VGW7_9BASI|nr:hypothetical protein VP01_1625g10 [Puccinia sorghi]